MRHIAVIDPGTKTPELDCFNRMARRSPVALTYHLPALHGSDSLHRASHRLQGIVILGSGASPLDDEPWQEALDAWLLPRLADDVPTLGLCYGHQHLAHRLGGKVGFVYPDESKIRGIRRIHLQPDRLWGSSIEGPMVVSHREMVTELPEGFRTMASSDDVPIDAFHHPSRPIWGFQPHPEATIAFTTNNSIPFEDDPGILSFGHGVVDAFLDFASAG